MFTVLSTVIAIFIAHYNSLFFMVLRFESPFCYYYYYYYYYYYFYFYYFKKINRKVVFIFYEIVGCSRVLQEAITFDL